MEQQNSLLYKTRLCNEFAKGRCNFGDSCKYAHGEADLRPLGPEGHQLLERLEASRQRNDGQPRAPAPPPQQQQQQGGGNQGRQKDESQRKSQLCQDFQRGRCSFGDRCFWAHSQDELRPAGPGRPAGGPGNNNHNQQNQGRLPGPPGAPGMMQGMQGGPGMAGMNPMMMGMGMGMGMPGQGMGGMMQPQGMGMMPFMGGQGMMMGGPGMGMGGMAGPGMTAGGNQGPSGNMAKQLQDNKPAAKGRGGPPGGSGPGGKQAAEHRGGGRTPAIIPTPPSTNPVPSPGAVASMKAGQGGGAAKGAASSAGAMSDPSVRAEVAYIERVAVTCGILNIGNAAVFSRERPDLVTAALAAVRNRTAYKANAYADDVTGYLPALPQPAASKHEPASA